MIENMKKVVRAFFESYLNTMSIYGDALFRGRGCCGCA